MVTHIEFTLPRMDRGYHLITRDIISKITPLPENGLLNLFIKHTSAALTINENADPSVLVDFEQIINRIVPEGLPFLTHTMEGPDDMPAHIKASLMGASVTVPIVNRSLALGTWQGIYLCEFRNRATPRKLIATIYS